MYVCIYVYMYECLNVYMYIYCAYVYVYAYASVYVHVYVCVYKWACKHIHSQVDWLRYCYCNFLNVAVSRPVDFEAGAMDARFPADSAICNWDLMWRAEQHCWWYRELSASKNNHLLHLVGWYVQFSFGAMSAFCFYVSIFATTAIQTYENAHIYIHREREICVER